MSDSAALWIVAFQAPLSKVFSRQEYWSGLPCPPPLTQGSNLVSYISCNGRQVLYHLCLLGNLHMYIYICVCVCVCACAIFTMIVCVTLVLCFFQKC